MRCLWERAACSLQPAAGMNLPLRARTVPLLLVLSLSTVAAAAEAPPSGPYLQPQVYRISGWTIMEEDPFEPEVRTIEFTDGAGVGLRLGYDFIPYAGLFLSAEFNVEQEGPYTGYGAGLALRSPMLGRVRLNGRLEVRLIDAVGTLPYGTLGVGAEVFLHRKVSLGLEFDASLPLADGTRFNGLQDVPISADGGPTRGIFTVTWYITG
jgi:hypothetical protein